MVLLALTALLAWGFSSPIGATPDEDFHLASIWCAQGERPGLCELSGLPESRNVSADIVHSADCYAYEAERSASCQGDKFGNGSAELVTTARGNFNNLYPPIFYWVMSWFASPNIYLSVSIMRIFNALLFIGISISVTILSFKLISFSYRKAFLIVLVPLGMFLISSVNPTSWAIATVPAAYVTTRAFLSSSGSRRYGLGILLLLLLIIGAGSRTDTGVFLIISIFLGSLSSLSKSIGIWKLVIPVFTSLLISFFFFMQSGQSTVVTQGLGGETSYEGSTVGLIAKNFLQAPLLIAGVFGEWGLGWLDTIMPAFVWVIGLVLFGIVVFVGFINTTMVKRATLVLSLCALWLIPVFVLVQSRLQVGEGVQPRYILPLALLVAIIALDNSGDVQQIISQKAWYGFALILTCSNAIALFINTQRYTTGVDVFNVNLNSYIEWSWPGMISPMLLWLVGSVSFGVLALMISKRPKTQILNHI
jgi:hypothetical protein